MNAYSFIPGAYQPKLSDLEQVIARGSYHIKYLDWRGPEIDASLKAVADAVESAYTLTAKADLPKVEAGYSGSFTVEGLGSLYPQGGQRTAENARKRAHAWLAVAQYLDVREKAKAYEEAKAKQVAEMAAEAAKEARLNELADEWFGKGYDELGDNKRAAIKEIYRLETKLAETDVAA